MRDRLAEPSVTPNLQLVSNTFERHYSPEALGELWGVSANFLRGVFEREPGVVVFESSKAGKRRYRTLRIPSSVAECVHRRLTVTSRKPA
jgi:hypothetical protein